jgi:predicted DNA-binding transcriptional regulator AlpA
MVKAATSNPASLSLIRPSHLARLLNVDLSTIWRYTKSGVLPAPRQIGPGLKGWTQADIAELLERRATAQPPAPLHVKPRTERIMPRARRR